MLQAEQIAHINIVNWFRHDFPELKEDLHHYANERFIVPRGGSEYHEGKILKQMGQTKNVSDFNLAFPFGEFHGMWLELKVGKNRLTPGQRRFLDRKRELGHYAVEAHGFEEAKEKFLHYLKDYISFRGNYKPKTGI